MEQLVAKAVLCARSTTSMGSLVCGLDRIFFGGEHFSWLLLWDTLDGGCGVNARDNHGNTLFILVCQQGNKKIAMFLMQDMNLQVRLHYWVPVFCIVQSWRKR
jgi:hypothetical protein